MYVAQKKSLLLSVLVTLVVTSFLFYWDGDYVEKINFLSEINTTVETQEFDLQFTSMPFYFSTIGNISATISSPYASLLNNMNLQLSVDGRRWTNVELMDHDISTDEKYGFSHVGYINLEEPNHLIYAKITTPTKLAKPINLEKEQILNSFSGSIIVQPIETRKDKILISIIAVGFFGTVYTIVLSFLKK